MILNTLFMNRTMETARKLLENAGFHDVRVLCENGDTVILRGEK